MGSILIAFGDVKRGTEVAKVAELLLEKKNTKEMKSKVHYILEGFVNHWTCPLQGTLQPLLQGYKLGLETGDTESACYNRKCLSPIDWVQFDPHVSETNYSRYSWYPPLVCIPPTR